MADEAGTTAGGAGAQEWLTLPQVARLYGVTPGRVRQMVKAGQLPAERNGRHYRVSRRWLDAQHARSGGLLPAADGRGLEGFLGTLSEADFEALLARAMRRVVVETFHLHAEALGAYTEFTERRKTG